MRHSAAVVSDLPTCEAVPSTIMARAIIEFFRPLNCVSPSPCSRPPCSSMLIVAQTGVHSAFEFDLPREQPDQIGETIDIRKRLRIDCGAAFYQANDTPLRTAAHGPGHFEGSRLHVGSRQ